MIKFQWNILLLAGMISSLGVWAQANPEIIFPEDVEGSLKLNLASIFTQSQETLTYHELAVFVQHASGEYGSNPIQGQYRREGNYLHFKPYFPFERGMIYVARIKIAHSESEYFYQSFQIGEKEKPGLARLESIYPSSHQLPENLLRFYLYFNTPMKKEEALKHIQLIDEEGNSDKHAFMEFKQELWSSDAKRLTLLFDPGRIKRGVSTNTLRGPALLEGKNYRLRISAAWQDVYGQALSNDTEKAFEVIPAYRKAVSINDWELIKPTPGKQDTLSMHFDRIIDHALIQSMIKLVEEDDKVIAGHWEISEREQLVQFIPDGKWKKGNYRLVIDSRLEDIAGNNLQNSLDHLTNDNENNKQLFQSIEFKL